MELSELVDRAACFTMLPPDLIDGPHGVSHWERTAIFAGWIADEADFELSQIQRNVILMSAICHDLGRTNDGHDPLHGYAGVLPAIRFMDSLRVLETIFIWQKGGPTQACHPAGKIMDIIIHHVDNSPGSIEEMQIVKDADKLDHMRFGKETLIKERLCLPASRKLIERAWGWIKNDTL